MAGRERQRHSPRARESREPELGSGPVSTGILGVQHAAGNRAVARLLVQRDLAPWKEGTFGKFMPTFSPESLIVQFLAEQGIDNPIMTMCIRNYVYGKGKPVHLTAAEVHKMWVQADLFGGTGFAKLKAARDELVAEAAKRQSGQQAADPEAKQAGFTHPIATTGMTRHIDEDSGAALTLALGTATMIIAGDVSYAERDGCTFTGKFALKDRWDFDVLGFATHRGLKNELETILGRFYLAGQPFDVTTDDLPIEQNQRGDHSVIREGS